MRQSMSMSGSFMSWMRTNKYLLPPGGIKGKIVEEFRKWGREMELTEEILRDALHYGKAFTKLGRTAQYIPELRAVNRIIWGSVLWIWTEMYWKSGDTRVPFTIQSISKLVSLILAIRDCGADHLFHEKVGVEPTGDPFNSIVKLETKTRPFNPFINAGAITVAKLYPRKRCR